MRQFKWNSTFSVYLPEIDNEHREIFKLAGELHRAITGGAETGSMDGLLAQLLDHTTSHFDHEESLMMEAEYPSRDWHIRQHDTARKKAVALVKRIRGGDTEAPIELLQFLSGWLKDHISVADQMMGAHLRNRRRLWNAMAS